MLKKVIAMLLTSIMVLSGTVISFAEKKDVIVLDNFKKISDEVLDVKTRANDTRLETRLLTGYYYGSKNIEGKAYSYTVKVLVRYTLEISPSGNRIASVDSITSSNGDSSVLRTYSQTDSWVSSKTDNIARVAGTGRCSFAITSALGSHWDVTFKLAFNKNGECL